MEAAASQLPEDSWDLRDLFENDAAYEQSKREFSENLLPPVERFRGRLLEDASTLADALEVVSRARERLQFLHCYAALRSDTDTQVPAFQAMRQEAHLLSTDLAQRTAYLGPEILSADPVRIESFLADEPRLTPYAHFLHDLMRQREHVLEPGEERIMAETGLIRGGPASLYQLLTNAELPRPEVSLSTGEVVRLTPVSFRKHRMTRNRADRQLIFPEYFAAHAGFRETLGHNLYAAIKEHVFRARTRGYESCLRAALDPENIPQSVYRNLISQVHERLPVLHRYFRLRAGALGVDRLEYPDLSCPLSDRPPASHSTPEAKRLVLESVAPLGREYGREIDRAFSSRWIDWHPRQGKRSGAYATGWARAAHPYVLLNFDGDYESVSTLAHEMGHAMHSYFSNATEPFPTADYSIFVAEVASTFNEALLLRHALEITRTDEERLYLVSSYLDGIRGTLFRQTMFAEFELDIHERAERGEVLTGEKLDEIYLEMLRRYHGHDEGVVHIGEEYAVEWTTIPHMYYDFYVYQYATGITAATALARAVAGDEPGARERYLEFLSSGGSDYPLSLLRRAGVDLQSPDPYRETFELVDRRLDQLESLLPPGDPPSTTR